MTLKNLSVSNHVRADEWDNDVIRLNGTSLHSYTWSRYSAENNSAIPVYFRLKDTSQQVVALSFGLLTEKKMGITLYSSLSFGSLATANDPAMTRLMACEIYQYSKDKHIVSLSMNSFGTPHGSEIIPEIGLTGSRRWEFLLDIGCTEKELWEKIHSKKRNLIRKGQKEGLTIVCSNDGHDLQQYRNLAQDTYERKTRQGIPYPKPGNAESINRMQKHLLDSGLGRLYLAFKNDQVVAGAFFTAFNHKVYYMLSSSGDIGLKLAAPDLILWTAMIDYQKEGFTVFNFGGLSETELNHLPLEKSGLYHFKKRFSPDVVPCYKGSLVLRPRQYKLYSFVKKLKALTP